MTENDLRRAGIVDCSPLAALIIVVAAAIGWGVILWGLWRLFT